jgi:hypothetical protein
MKALAQEIARLAKITPEGPSPSICSLYRYLVRFYGDEGRAVQTLERFLNGTMPEIFTLAETTTTFDSGASHDHGRTLSN